MSAGWIGLGGRGGNWLEGEEEAEYVVGAKTGDVGILTCDVCCGVVCGERGGLWRWCVGEGMGVLGEGGGGRSWGTESNKNGTIGAGSDCRDKERWMGGEMGGMEGS